MTVFDPKITPGPWASGEVKGIHERSNEWLWLEDENIKAIIAVPELLEVYKAARSLMKKRENLKNPFDPSGISFGISIFFFYERLQEAIEKLEDCHCKDSKSEIKE